jgi:hypothetical protein
LPTIDALQGDAVVGAEKIDLDVRVEGPIGAVEDGLEDNVRVFSLFVVSS